MTGSDAVIPTTTQHMERLLGIILMARLMLRICGSWQQLRLMGSGLVHPVICQECKDPKSSGCDGELCADSSPLIGANYNSPPIVRLVWFDELPVVVLGCHTNDATRMNCDCPRRQPKVTSLPI
jgi:hypothetical protein